mmetsp:Transcript_8647/g.20831  ORF Transcript_8647/g.20831 Transcript_8647/m.20831 type:complete len:99 (-) Transcript_8647:1032-1328(-)
MMSALVTSEGKAKAENSPEAEDSAHSADPVPQLKTSFKSAGNLAEKEAASTLDGNAATKLPSIPSLKKNDNIELVVEETNLPGDCTQVTFHFANSRSC